MKERNLTIFLDSPQMEPVEQDKIEENDFPREEMQGEAGSERKRDKKAKKKSKKHK